MFIERDQVEALAGYQNRNHPVISVYLNVTPPRSVSSELNSMIHTTLRALEEDDRYTREQVKGVQKVMEKIEEHVQKAYKRTAGIRLAVIFADADGLWQEYPLPVALPNTIGVDVDPYTRPLTMLLDEFDRYCVVVADSRKARIFSLYLGEMEESPDVFLEDNVPDGVRVKQSMTAGGGGTVKGGLGDKRIERHIQDHVHRHLKHVAERTLNFFKRKNFTRLLLGGPEDKTIPRLKDHLHSYLRDRLAAEFSVHPDNNLSEIKEKALAAAQSWERRRERELIDSIVEHSGPGDKGELGIEPVLEALNLGQVQTLVIRHDFKASGYVCPNDHILSTYLSRCPACEIEMHPTEFLADEMVEEALNQNAEIEHVFAPNETLDQYGVAVKLRFVL